MTAIEVPVQATGPADLRRQKRLDQLVARLGDGMDAAAEIWANWEHGERFVDLHPGQSAAEYIASLGLRLTLGEAMAALPNASTRQVAAVAGVSNWKVATERAAVRNLTPDEPEPKVIGSDGKSYPGRVVKTIEVIEPDRGAAVAPSKPRGEFGGWQGLSPTKEIQRAARRLVLDYGGLPSFQVAHPKLRRAALIDAFVEAARALIEPTPDELQRELAAAERQVARVRERQAGTFAEGRNTTELSAAFWRLEKAHAAIERRDPVPLA